LKTNIVGDCIPVWYCVSI